MSIEAMKQALEALDSLLYWDNGKPEYDEAREAITALRAAIEQAEKQEPVGVVRVLPLGDGHKPMHWADWTDADNPPPEDTFLYTTPPAAQRKWVGLTDEEIWSDGSTIGLSDRGIREFARAIEAKLREKNGGAV